jgi:hypothetical protein
MNGRFGPIRRRLAVAGILLRGASFVLPGIACGHAMAPPPKSGAAWAAEHQRKTLQLAMAQGRGPRNGPAAHG